MLLEAGDILTGWNAAFTGVTPRIEVYNSILGLKNTYDFSFIDAPVLVGGFTLHPDGYLYAIVIGSGFNDDIHLIRIDTSLDEIVDQGLITGIGVTAGFRSIVKLVVVPDSHYLALIGFNPDGPTGGITKLYYFTTEAEMIQSYDLTSSTGTISDTFGIFPTSNHFVYPSHLKLGRFKLSPPTQWSFSELSTGLDSGDTPEIIGIDLVDDLVYLFYRASTGDHRSGVLIVRPNLSKPLTGQVDIVDNVRLDNTSAMLGASMSPDGAFLYGYVNHATVFGDTAIAKFDITTGLQDIEIPSPFVLTRDFNWMETIKDIPWQEPFPPPPEEDEEVEIPRRARMVQIIG